MLAKLRNKLALNGITMAKSFPYAKMYSSFMKMVE